MSTPVVAPNVVADVLDALPPRLRKRVDTALDKVAGWEVRVDGDTATAVLDADTTLTWTLRGGVLTAAADLVCTCLLAPKCLHRGVAVAAAEVADTASDAPADPVASDGPAVAAEPVVSEVDGGFGEPERHAAGGLWSAAAGVLRVGATGSGVVVRAELLRAVHTARVVGLHRAAATGLRIAASLAAARSGDSSFDREVLTAELTELLLLCHDIRAGHGDPGELRGTARREYHPVGALRLYGLCTEAVVTTSGYAGVVTHLVDDSGMLWSVPAIMPGGRERVPVAAAGPVAIGESGLTQRELGRRGLLLSGGTASADRRLGAGRNVRAVAASGAAWTEPPLAALWAESLPDQLNRAFDTAAAPASHRSAGGELLFLDATVLGLADGALRVATDHGPVDLVGEGERARDNLRVLDAPGLALRFVARPLPDRPGTATALAVAGDDLTLPSELSGRADLTLDRLQRAYLAVRTDPPTTPLPPRPTPDRVPAPVRPLENVLHRTTLGGRAVVAVGAVDPAVAYLTALGLTTTATLLSTLTATSRNRERDAFGRVLHDEGDDFPTAWLRAAVHLRAVVDATARRAWLPG
ncbi:hypothetical protein [Actinosynnema sp. NPDC020468]|uniref:hypothetical protein n=1 Tax=Actinosynnema sp. NPDC020468 TaxID=3154488 RepID=UPI0033F5E54A